MSEPSLWGSRIPLPTEFYPHVTALRNGAFLVAGRTKLSSGFQLKMWVYNADGSLKAEQLLEIPDGIVPSPMDSSGGVSLGRGHAFDPMVVELPDGRLSLTWTEDRITNGGGYMAPWTVIYNSDLTLSGKPTLVVSQPEMSWDHYRAQSVASLEDSRIIVAMSCETNGKALVRIVSPDGSRSNLLELSAATATRTDLFADLTTLDNGNVALILREDLTTFKGYVLVPSSSSGLSVSKTFSIEATAVPPNAEVKVTALEGGRFVVTWTEMGKTDPTETEPHITVRFQVFGAEGQEITDEPVAFYASNQEAASVGTPDVIALPGGGFALAAQVVTSMTPESSEVRLAVFDAAGTRVSDRLLISQPAAEGTFSLKEMSMLADGRIAVHLSNGIQIVDPRNEAISMKGTAQDDHYIGTAFSDTFDGSAGADRLDGSNGIDFISFANAKAGVTASLSGGSGGDAAGDIYISIEGLVGSSFDDTFIGNGSAILKGRAGNDTYFIKAGDVFEEAVDEGHDTVIVGGSYALKADAQIEVIRLSGVSSKTSANLTGSNTGNEILGHSGTNTLKGQGSNDLIKAYSGSDRIYGGTGNDTIYGGTGNDRLSGDAGRDTFVFDTRPSKSTNMDWIVDFNPTYDSFQLDNAVFARLGSGTASRPKKFTSDMFVKGKAAEDKEDRIIYDSKTGALYYDPDGTGSRAQVKIATISNKTKLAYHDFFVI